MTDPLVIFHHIPKTAGMSVVTLLRTNYPEGQLLEFYARPGSPPPPAHPHEFVAALGAMEPVQLERVRCISGHSAQHAMPALQRPFRAFTLIRDPVERILSLYHFVRDSSTLSGVGGRTGAMIREEQLTLDDVFDRFTGKRPADRAVYRLMAAFFNGQTRAILAPHYAIETIPLVGWPENHEELTGLLDQVIGERYVLGCTERYEQSLERFAADFGWSDTTAEQVNVNRSRPPASELSEELVEKIRNANQLDLELHRRALAAVGGTDEPPLARTPQAVGGTDEPPLARTPQAAGARKAVGTPTAVAATLAKGAPSRRAFVKPEDLLREIVEDPLRLRTEVLDRSVDGTVERTELRLLAEVHEGEPLHMHAWLCRPLEAPGLLAPVLSIPGGSGALPDARRPTWLAETTGALVLAVDQLGAGRSSRLPKALRERGPLKDGDDHRESYEYRNLRALVRAIEVLLSQPEANPDQLTLIGAGTGGFYGWLVAGLDPRVRNLVTSFGCGFLDDGGHAESWLRAFDPGRRAHLIEANVFFQCATNDREYGLSSALDTYRRVRSTKRLLLIANQERTVQPYDGQDTVMLRAMLDAAEAREMPEIRSVRWLPGTTTVKVDAAHALTVELSVVYSTGPAASDAARRWHSVPAEFQGGRFVAEIPVVDPGREIWFFGHAAMPAPHSAPQRAGDADAQPLARGASTPVQRIVPAEVGVEAATAEFEPAFEPGSLAPHELPLTDRRGPAMRLVADAETTALAMRFGGSSERRGIVGCLEGDMIAAAGHDAIEVLVKVPGSDDAAGLDLCLVTDLHAPSELEHRIELETLGRGYAEWQTVRIPFASFPGLEPARLSGVGLVPAQPNFRGEAWLGPVRTFAEEAGATGAIPPAGGRTGAAATPTPSGHGEAEIGDYDVFIETTVPAETLRAELRRWQPFRHEFIFSTGVRTSEFQTAAPFATRPGSAWRPFEEHIPDDALHGRRALELGSQMGALSLYLHRRYGMEVVGVESDERNIAAARFAAEAGRLRGVRFLAADPNHYRVERRFALILLIGVLRRTRHPLLALQNARAMLERSGHLALVVRTLEPPSGPSDLCRFMSGAAGPRWLIGMDALVAMLRDAGFGEITVVQDSEAAPVDGAATRRVGVVARAGGA